jgi:phenylacetic acid degradation operon negative regulatory protein
VLAHPSANLEPADGHPAEQRGAGRGRDPARQEPSALFTKRRPGNWCASAGTWSLIAKDYKRFADRFRPLLKALRSARVLDPEQCFLVRTLLMHEFRRTLLRDPQLPEQLLPGDWPGNSARQLCRDLYVLTQKEAENHLMSVLQTASGRLPEAAPYFYERFGGIGSA